MDDDRPRYGMSDIYNQAKQLGIPVIGHQHGNQEIVNILCGKIQIIDKNQFLKVG